jgi:hypothetical protein
MINLLADDIEWKTVSDEQHTLTTVGESLDYRYITDVQVRQNGTLLTDGTHYRTVSGPGAFIGVNGASGSVSVSYTAAESRYDTLWWNPIINSLGGAAGTAHSWNPDEFIPPVPPGMLPLFHVYFWKTATAEAHIQLIPICNFRKGVALGREGEFAYWLAQSREQLPKTFRDLRAGNPIRIIGLGTSITRQLLDDISYFSGHYKPDALARIPYQGKVGWNYAIKRKMEGVWGVPVTYVNLGVNGNVAPNVLSSAQELGLGQNLPGLVVIEFGPNEFGSVSLSNDIAAIITFVRQRGGECIVMGQSPMSEYVQLSRPEFASHEAREANSEKLARSAEAMDVPFVSTFNLFGRGNEGASGLSRHTMGAADAFQHPGYQEIKAEGDFVARIFG